MDHIFVQNKVIVIQNIIFLDDIYLDIQAIFLYIINLVTLSRSALLFSQFSRKSLIFSKKNVCK